MELRSFIKVFTWEEEDRERVILGPDTRLNPETHRAQLGSWDSDTYPTDDDLYVKSWVANPIAVKEWQGFEAITTHVKIDGVQVTSVKFRLSDGTDQYWWNGSAWAVNTTDWNTEEEVAANIPAFPATARKLQVVANLKTTDSSATPELVGVKVLFGCLLDDEIEDLVLRSLVPKLRSDVRPITRFPVEKAETGVTIALGDFTLDGDYRVVDVDAAFNHTDDAVHDTDIYDSHTSNPDGTVDVITLSASVTAGKTVWLRLIYEPVVAVETSRDYVEVEHIPSLLIDTIIYAGKELWGEDHVGNKGDGTAKVLPGPLQGPLDLTLRGMADKLVDHMRLASKVKRFFGANKILTSTGLDESYTLRLIDEHEHTAGSNAEDIHTWRKTFRVENFRIWTRDVQDGYLVQRFVISGSVDVTVE